MVKRKYISGIVVTLNLVLIFSSCTNNHLPWRSGYLVAQLYRQPQQQILLAYNNFVNEMTIDEQNDYSRAYFDNYRKEMIFQKEGKLEYLIGGQAVTPVSEHIAGYTSQVLFNERYQIGVEVLDVKDGSLGDGQFWGTKSRIIDLNTQKSIIIDGLLFNPNLIVDHYFYGFTFDDQENQFLDIVDLETMKHQRINMTENEITFLYQRGNQVYGQCESKQTAFIFDGMNMNEQKSRYNPKLTLSKDAWPILKDVAPSKSNQHWYINPIKEYDVIVRAQLLRLTSADEKTVMINFQRQDIIQIMDVTNYSEDNIAFFLTTKDDEGQLHAIITVFDLQGKEVYSKEITEMRTNNFGRFTYLDYVE